jgi:FkbM family methyltransferase
MSLMKKFVAALPDRFQFEIESHLRSWQVRAGRFTPGEPEYYLLPELVSAGDWVLDIGANIGHYTVELARLVGPMGRVVSMEPMTRPFAQLTRLVVRAGLHNVTLINAAASDTGGLATMEVPSTRDGLALFYQARLTEGGGRKVMTLRVDDLPLGDSVSLVKIDVEGHEVPVLNGMRDLIGRCRPVLVVENSSPKIQHVLSKMGYGHEKLRGSPNLLFRPLQGAST